jgi:hypothetical protein
MKEETSSFKTMKPTHHSAFQRQRRFQNQNGKCISAQFLSISHDPRWIDHQYTDISRWSTLLPYFSDNHRLTPISNLDMIFVSFPCLLIVTQFKWTSLELESQFIHPALLPLIFILHICMRLELLISRRQVFKMYQIAMPQQFKGEETIKILLFFDVLFSAAPVLLIFNLLSSFSLCMN